jgi:hypothetical protein
MIELTCQTCAEKVGVESFLAAAQQPCRRCGQLLMGPVARGRQTVRPSECAELPAQPFGDGRGSVVALWFGVFAGGLAGVAAVVAVAYLGLAIPLAVRGGLLGALMGVLLAPVLMIASFIVMIIPGLKWIDLFGMLGDSAWSRLASALHQGKISHLIFPLFVFVVLPMAACGYGGSKMKTIQTPMLLAAGLGAALLGAILGGAFGGRSR